MIIKMEKLQVQNLNREIQRRQEAAAPAPPQPEQPVASAEPVAPPVAEEAPVAAEPQAEESTAEPTPES